MTVDPTSLLAADGPSVVGWVVVAVILLVLAAVLMAVLRRGRAGGAISPIDQPRSPVDQPPLSGPDDTAPTA
jgi:hypothetical protein